MNHDVTPTSNETTARQDNPVVRTLSIGLAVIMLALDVLFYATLPRVSYEAGGILGLGCALGFLGTFNALYFNHGGYKKTATAFLFTNGLILAVALSYGY